MLRGCVAANEPLPIGQLGAVDTNDGLDWAPVLFDLSGALADHSFVEAQNGPGVLVRRTNSSADYIRLRGRFVVRVGGKPFQV